ncbi:hypothetical protein ACWD4X_06870 [Streptomyces termitum]
MTAKKAGGDLPPGRRALSEALWVLYGHLRVKTLAEAAQLLDASGWKKDPSEISRYRNGRRKPPFSFIERMHELAARRAAPGAALPSLSELRKLHTDAEATLCRNCEVSRQENDRLREENSRLLSRQAPEPRAKADSIPAKSGPPVTLPVPPAAGDRQRDARDVAAAHQLADSALDLHTSGRTGYAVSLLQDSASSLTPLESAAAIALLRGTQDDLAETVIGIHSRSRTSRDVMQIAVELHSFGLPQDAHALLQAALSHPPAAK